MEEYSKYIVVTQDKYGNMEINDSFLDEADAHEHATYIGDQPEDEYEVIVVYKAISVGERKGFEFTKVK